MEEEIEELKNTDAAFDMYLVDKTLTRSAGINQGFGNEGMSFGYSSVAQYASTDDMQMKELLMKWGYGSNNKHLPIILFCRWIPSGCKIYLFQK